MTKLEEVARAICKAMNINPDGYASAHKFHAWQDRRDGGDLVTLRNWEAAAHVARAAVTAMRAPTPGMIEAGAGDAFFGWQASEIYTAMIDAILTEQP